MRIEKITVALAIGLQALTMTGEVKLPSKDGKMHIFVTEAPNNICPTWTDLQGFEIAGEDGVYHPAKAQVIDRPTCIELSSSDVPAPKHARYAFHNFPEYSVYSGAGLPLLPFRTDRSK